MRQSNYYLSTNALLIMVLAFFAEACYKPIDDVQLPSRWEPEMALPIGYTDLTVKDKFSSLPNNSDTIPVYYNDTLYYLDSAEIQMMDILPFELKSVTKNTTFIRKITFRVNMNNGFPYRTLLQLYLLDSQHQIVDSLLSLDQRIFVPGIKQMDIPFTWSRIQQIMDMQSIRVKSGIVVNRDTTDNDTTKLRSEYHVKVQVGIRIAFVINPDSTFNK